MNRTVCIFNTTQVECLGNEMANAIEAVMEACEVDEDNLGLIKFMPGFFSDLELKAEKENFETLKCFLKHMDWVDFSNNISRKDVRSSLSLTSLGSKGINETDQRCHDKGLHIDIESVVKFIISGDSEELGTGTSDRSDQTVLSFFIVTGMYNCQSLILKTQN